MKAGKNRDAEERKRALAEEKVAREREKKAALAQHEREKTLAAERLVNPADELKALRERYRSSFEMECARRNPDAALETRLRSQCPDVEERHLTAWARAKALEQSTDEAESRIAELHLEEAWRDRQYLLAHLAASPPAEKAPAVERLKESLKDLERSRRRELGTAEPATVGRSSGVSWRIAAEALQGAYPDRYPIYLGRLALHVWSAHDHDQWQEPCGCCGLPPEDARMARGYDAQGSLRWLGPLEKAPARSWARARFCFTCLKAAILLVDQQIQQKKSAAAAEPESAGADAGLLRADVVRAIRALAPPDEVEQTVAHVEGWLAQPLLREPPPPPQPLQVDAWGNPLVATDFCGLCYSRSADGSVLTVRLRRPDAPGRVWNEDERVIRNHYCRRCLMQALSVLERKVVRRRGGAV